MPRFMLDADTVSYAIRGVGQVATRILEHRPSELCISSITLAELRFGAETKRSRKLDRALRSFVNDCRPGVRRGRRRAFRPGWGGPHPARGTDRDLRHPGRRPRALGRSHRRHEQHQAFQPRARADRGELGLRKSWGMRGRQAAGPWACSSVSRSRRRSRRAAPPAIR